MFLNVKLEKLKILIIFFFCVPEKAPPTCEQSSVGFS